MLEAPSPSGIFSRIREDHRRLGPILLDLEKCERADQICSHAESLQPWLLRHFEEEEEPSGVFESIERQDPRHGHEITILINEHRIMLEQVGSLAELARSAQGETSISPKLAASLRAFLLVLRQHERKESRLLTDAIYHEEGGGD